MTDQEHLSVTSLALSLRRQLELMHSSGIHHVMVDTHQPGGLMEALRSQPQQARSAGHLEDRRPPSVRPQQSSAQTKAQPVIVDSVSAKGLRSLGGTLALQLAAQADQAAQCAECGLCSTRTQSVYSRGNPYSPLMIIGEAPGADEDKQGEPFVGRAGKLLDEILSKGMGYDPSTVYICNVLKCRPPNNRNPEPEEIEACRHFLESQIRLVNPEVIIAMGRFPAQWLMKSGEGIGKLRGKMVEVDGRKIVATYHPAYLLRNPSANKLVWEDVQLVMEHFGRGEPLKLREPA